MSLADFSTLVKARILLTKGTTDSNAQALQKELTAWEKSIEASYQLEGLSGLASLQIDDLFPIDKKTGKPKKGQNVRSKSKFRVAGMKKDNTNFIVTDAGLKLIWDQEGLPAPKIDGTKVIIGSYEDAVDAYSLLDAFNVWLINTNKIIFSSQDKKTGEYKNTSVYTYDKNNVEYYGQSKRKSSKLNPTINAIRIKGTGHTHTAKIMYSFLKACGYREDFSTFADNYQIGHVDSQAHLKATITRGARNSAAYSGGLIDKLIQLNKYLDLGSSSLKPIHSGIIAAIDKNSRGSKVAMNVEMQPKGEGAKGKKDPISNQGSADLSHALNIISILKNLGTTAVKVPKGDQPAELRTLGASADAIAKNLNRLYKNYQKNKATVELTLNNFSKSPGMAQFLLDLESSDSMRTFIKKSVVHGLDPKTPKPSFKANLKNVPVLELDNNSSEKLIQDNKKLAADIKQQLTKVKAMAAKAKSADKAKRNKPASTASNFTIPQYSVTVPISLISLQNLINQGLAEQIQSNMGTGSSRSVLNYRSGRLAESAKVERMSESRAGMITAFYSYMRNPYGTFAEGGAQEFPVSRNPKTLIALSIRQLAGTQVANRMRAVLV